MRLQAVIFDLGGTLLHYQDKSESFRDVTQMGLMKLYQHLSGQGYDLPPATDLLPLLGQHIRETYRAEAGELRGGTIEKPILAGLAEAGLTLDDGDWEVARGVFYSATDGIVYPREGMHATLEALRERGYKLGLISNTYWAADLHDRHLAEHNLIDLLPERIYSSDTPYTKPHPAIFQMMTGRLGVEPGEAAYVGDRPDVDVGGAQGAGLLGVLIRSPFRTEGLGDVLPDVIIDELPDLLPALERLEAQG